MRSEQPSVWFSHYFGVDLPQYDLPFIDFVLTADVPLYIDSYAITKDASDLARVCQHAIVSYFQTLLDAVRTNNAEQVRQLVRGRLVEPREIHLGVGRSARAGIGLGAMQESQVVEALTQSEALKTGLIQDIQELELHIDGLGPDKVSDLVANVVKGHLANYTEKTCIDYQIPTRPCAVSAFWNSIRGEWDAGFFNLPVREIDAYILVPKHFVRRDRDLINHRYFYDKYVLDVLQREMLDANDSLTQTLKNGTRRVTKKSLREDSRFRLTKAYVSQFIHDHPGTINSYRLELAERFDPTDPAMVSGKSLEEDPSIQEVLDSLVRLPIGRDHAMDYHQGILSLIKFSFDWALENFESEYKMDGGRGRIDIICDNYAPGGLFAEWKRDLTATSIPIECKNYGTDLGNDEFNQLNDRLGDKTSRLGLLFCRKVTNTVLVARHVTDRWLRHHNCILLFDDDRVKALVDLRLRRDFDGIQGMLRRMVRDVEYGPRS